MALTHDEQWALDCVRDPAWNRAQEDFALNGLSLDIQWKRCVVSGITTYMDDDCWDDLIAAYPAP